MAELKVSGSTGRDMADVAERAAAEFGFGSHDLELVSHYANTIFRLTTASGRYVVRVHRAADRTATEVAGVGVRSPREWVR